MELSDGTIIPSYLGVRERGISAGSNDMLTNYVLRYGEVRSIDYPGANTNNSGDQVEYTVEVQHRDGGGLTASTLYRGVTASNLFGGVADRTEMTYRADTKNSDDGIGNGSKVLVLCISGDQQKAVILGGVSSPVKKETKKGHNFFFEFNGAQFTVNNEGEAQFLHRGPTDASGAIKDQYADYSDAFVKFDKSGNIIVSGPGGEQFAKLVHQNNDNHDLDASVQFQADKLLRVDVRGQTEITTGGNTFIESVDGGIQLTSSDGVTVGTASDYWIKGSTYRMAEGTCNQTLAGSLTSAASLCATMSATLMTAAGLNAMPMIGGILAMPAFMLLAGQLGGLGGIFGAMSGAINALEGNADKYLSQKNKAD